MEKIPQEKFNKLIIKIILSGLIFLIGIGLIIYTLYQQNYFTFLNQNSQKNNSQITTNENSYTQKVNSDESANENTNPTEESQPNTEETTTTPNNETNSNNATQTPQNWWDYPNEILTTTKDGSDPLVLVNKKYKLPSIYQPNDLVDSSATGFSGGHQIRSVIVGDLIELRNAAVNAGISLDLQSGYRSYSTQEGTYSYWLSYNGGDQAYTDQISARAGHSQHQLGTAVDFNSYEGGYLRLWQDFNITNAAAWLKDNSWKYGFIMSYPEGREAETGFAYEGWHFRWIGKDNAQQCYNSGLVLDKWLESR